MVKSKRKEVGIPTNALLPTEQNYRPQGGLMSHPAVVLVGAGLIANGLWSGALLGLNIWLFWCLMCVATIFVGRRRQMLALRENQRGVALLNGGRLKDAAHIFESLTRSQRGTSSHSVYVFNRGVAFMLQGRLKRAFSLFNAVRRSRQFIHLQAHGPTMFVDMATCLALDGDLDGADQFHAKAVKAAGGKNAAKLVFSEAVLSLRRGHDDQARACIERNLHGAQTKIRVPSRRALLVLYAFSARKTGNPSKILESLGTVTSNEFAWLGVSWSEMSQFQSHYLR